MKLRLGDILVEQGVLTASQIDAVLAAQDESGEPFGAICERLFSVSAESIEEAWAIQYARITRCIDPGHESFEDRALALVSRRQAWQFRFLPVRFDGDELMVATTRRHLRRALRFATRFIGVPVYFVMADTEAHAEALMRHYPLSGAAAGAVDDDSIDALLARIRDVADDQAPQPTSTGA